MTLAALPRRANRASSPLLRALIALGLLIAVVLATVILVDFVSSAA